MFTDKKINDIYIKKIIVKYILTLDKITIKKKNMHNNVNIFKLIKDRLAHYQIW